MRQKMFEILVILDGSGDIIHANCGCEDGHGPESTCKHIAALCHALEDFVKVFVLPEDVQLCTGEKDFEYFQHVYIKDIENTLFYLPTINKYCFDLNIRNDGPFFMAQ